MSGDENVKVSMASRQDLHVSIDRCRNAASFMAYDGTAAVYETLSSRGDDTNVCVLLILCFGCLFLRRQPVALILIDRFGKLRGGLP